MEKRVSEMLDLAHRIIEEGRAPTDAEREAFRELESDVRDQPGAWRERFADLVDRFAAALEGIGL